MAFLDRGRFKLADCDSFLDSEFGQLLLAKTLESELSSQGLSEDFSPLLLTPRNTNQLHGALPPAQKQDRGSSDPISGQLGPAT